MVTNALAHDLQLDPPMARPYLARRYQFVVFAFYAAVAVAILGAVLLVWQRKALVGSLASKRDTTTAHLGRQTAAATRAEALRLQLTKAHQLDAWVSLGSPVQQFYLDVVDTLESNMTITELNIVRSRSQPQLTMEIAFAAEQTRATLQFQKTIGVLVQKGYRTVTVDQSNFAGGVKFSCTLIYPKRG